MRACRGAGRYGWSVARIAIWRHEIELDRLLPIIILKQFRLFADGRKTMLVVMVGVIV